MHIVREQRHIQMIYVNGPADVLYLEVIRIVEKESMGRGSNPQPCDFFIDPAHVKEECVC